MAICLFFLAAEYGVTWLALEMVAEWPYPLTNSIEIIPVDILIRVTKPGVNFPYTEYHHIHFVTRKIGAMDIE